MNSVVELICVDDGSTDGSSAVLDEFAKANSGLSNIVIKTIHQRNRGVSAARNTALDLATGEWVLFLDGDDRYDAGFLCRIAEAIKDNPNVDAIAYGFYMIDAGGNPLDRQPTPPIGANVAGDDILAECPNGNWRYTYSSCDKAYRRSVFERYHLRFTEGMKLGEDMLFANQFLSVCGNVFVSDGEIGYQCVVRDGSALRSICAETLKDDLIRFQETLEWWRKYSKPGLLKTLTFWAMALPSLGKDRGARSGCIEILLQSEIFNREVICFLCKNGTIKARCFAIAYKVMPRIIRRALLRLI